MENIESYSILPQRFFHVCGHLYGMIPWSCLGDSTKLIIAIRFKPTGYDNSTATLDIAEWRFVSNY